MHYVILKDIHGFLFDGLLDTAGEFRKTNIWKNESILYGRSVTYADFRSIKSTLEYDFQEEREQKYVDMDKVKMNVRLSDFCSRIWQVHPFMEGNTRTTAVFMVQYFRALGFDVNNDLFLENALYFRNALVRSNYADISRGIASDPQFLEG